MEIPKRSIIACIVVSLLLVGCGLPEQEKTSVIENKAYNKDALEKGYLIGTTPDGIEIRRYVVRQYAEYKHTQAIYIARKVGQPSTITFQQQRGKTQVTEVNISD